MCVCCVARVMYACVTCCFDLFVVFTHFVVVNYYIFLRMMTAAVGG